MTAQHEMNHMQSSRYEICAEEFAASLLADARSTGGRFNLVRPAFHQNQTFVHDIIFSTRGEGAPEAVSARFLVADTEAVNIADYQRLERVGVPQLKLLNTSDNLAVFNIPRGAKRLSTEPFRGYKSTATYIGDREIYRQAGLLYAAAWRATGKIMLDTPESNPAAQLAITNFADEYSQYLYLCPPYGEGQQAGSYAEARRLLLDAFTANLPTDITPYRDRLLEAVAVGFSVADTEAA